MSENYSPEKIPLRDNIYYTDVDKESIKLIGRNIMNIVGNVISSEPGLMAFRKLIANENATDENVIAKMSRMLMNQKGMILLYSDDEVVGFGGYENNPYVNVPFSKIYGIIFPQVQRKGLGIDLGRLVVQSALNNSGMKVILSEVRNDNTPSLNLNNEHLVPYFRGEGYRVETEVLDTVTKFKFFTKK